MSTLLLQQKWGSFSLIQKFSASAAMIQLWLDRHNQRKQLAKLEPEQLTDIGLNKIQVREEIKKPFWK